MFWKTKKLRSQTLRTSNIRPQTIVILLQQMIQQKSHILCSLISKFSHFSLGFISAFSGVIFNFFSVPRIKVVVGIILAVWRRRCDTGSARKKIDKWDGFCRNKKVQLEFYSWHFFLKKELIQITKRKGLERLLLRKQVECKIAD